MVTLGILTQDLKLTGRRVLKDDGNLNISKESSVFMDWKVPFTRLFGKQVKVLNQLIVNIKCCFWATFLLDFKEDTDSMFTSALLTDTSTAEKIIEG